MRRLVSVFVLSLVFAPGVALAQRPAEEPIGNLAQLMRGIMFPNSNKLFDVQSQDPAEPVPQVSETLADTLAAMMGFDDDAIAAAIDDDRRSRVRRRVQTEVSTIMSAAVGPSSSRFASIYRGWPTVEGAAVALADGAKLLMTPGRLCMNGVPAPVDQADYIEGARLLEEAAVKVLEGARNEDQEAVSDATNYVSDSCSYCHKTYRDGPDSRGEDRCR